MYMRFVMTRKHMFVIGYSIYSLSQIEYFYLMENWIF